MSTITATPALRPRSRAVKPTILTLGTHRLKQPLPCTVIPDGDEWHAFTPVVPQVFGLGATQAAAVASLRRELASLYADLTADPAGFTPGWAAVRTTLAGLMVAP